jgi:hypothetical protein
MKRLHILLVALVSAAIFLLVYSPHFNYRFPYHIDEWHHISESIKLKEGGYSGGITGFRFGFHVLLLGLGLFLDLVFFYKWLPAIWAVVSGLILFYVVYKKTGKFSIGLFSMIFFASIKSNVNITGLWFFSPLSFCIPFIFLYIYYFTEGIFMHNKKYILISLGIMIFLLPIHSISVLFAIPFLGIYSLFYFNYIKKEWKFFSSFLILPVIGALFFSFMMKIPLSGVFSSLAEHLQFKTGWGVLELKNAFTEMYSLIGYILAVAGVFMIFLFYKKPKKYTAYIIWPLWVLLLILIFRISSVSYLSPYQRNLYYFVLGMPLLSALGLYFIIELVKPFIKFKYSKEIITVVLLLIAGFFAFKDYYDVPKQLELYKVINDNDYEALLFLKQFPTQRIMADPLVSVALFPITRHEPVATLAFYGNRKDSEAFFLSKDCETKMELIEKYKTRYILSKIPINCGWNLIYNKNNFIYEVPS